MTTAQETALLSILPDTTNKKDAHSKLREVLREEKLKNTRLLKICRDLELNVSVFN
jgi:hypothetical protein